MESGFVTILQFLSLNHYFNVAHYMLSCCCLDFNKLCQLHIFVAQIDAI